jgi:uncharacterized protein YecE (DUF72 family)
VITVGTAGWSLPKPTQGRFRGEGTHLARYARVLHGAEINSSFYRSHSTQTYAKWAAQTPPTFRFAVKVPRSITHEGRLRRARRPLEKFLGEVAGLGDKLGPLLIQLPPSFHYDRRVARAFLALLREYHQGPVVLEPRHESWFTTRAEAVLVAHRVSRVAADPASPAAAAEPGGWPDVAYYRLHGSPAKYWSVYPEEQVEHWARSLRRQPRDSDSWCIFDNTAGGGAVGNALQMTGLLADTGRAEAPEGARLSSGLLEADPS